ncbi:MAG: TonB-dependent receptor [Bacteroidaceae bacterium]|nr:TonB-dependent receptor [Bacteroidaceae bacterium]
MENTMKTFRRFLCCLVLSMVTSVAFAQSNVVKGVVVDSSGEPVIGAKVMEKGNPKSATVTDIDGNYSLSLSKSKGTIVVSMVGMTPKEMAVSAGKRFSVTLEDDEKQMEEVIVVGYGQQKKASVVGAITQTTGEVLERAAGVTNLGSALTGNLPGVVTVASSGQPGEEEPEITIRGAASWNGNSAPLVLVDGIERPMSSVDVNSVATVSVLKDASATAVYGVKGANGVILITTKRGQDGKARIDVGFNTVIKQASRLPGKYDSYDALVYRNMAVENELAISPESWAYVKPMSFIQNYRNQGNLRDEFGTLLSERYPNVDWQNALFNNHAMSYNANMNISGGTQFVKYFVAFDFANEGDLSKMYDNNRGYKGGYTYNRLNVRSNLDFQLTKTTTLSANLFGSNGIKKAPFANQGDVWQEAQRWAGAYNIAPDVFVPQYEDGSWGYYPSASNVSNSAENLATAGMTQTTTTRITTDFTLDQDLKFITPGLRATATISWDNTFQENSRGINDLYNDTQRKYIDPETGQILFNHEVDSYDGYDWTEGIKWSTMGGNVNNGATYRSMNYRVQLNYARKFGAHDVLAQGVFERQESAQGSVVPARNESWVFRAAYNYGGRYFAEYNGSYRGSEKFAPGNRFAFFHSGAIGYTISEEKFWTPIRKYVDMLKFRASYGSVGSDAFGNAYDSNRRWLYLSQWAYGGASRIDVTPSSQSIYQWYRETSIGNENISWEIVNKKNFGIEYIFFGGLLRGSVDLFRDDRSNVFIFGTDRTVPSYFGGTAPTVNKGKVKTTGYELELRVDKTFKRGVHLWANMNMTHARNVIVLRDDAELLPNYRKSAGYTVGQTVSHIDNGFITSYDQLLGTPNHDANDGAMLIGDHYIMDFNGDGVVDNVNDQAPYAYSGTPENTYNATLGLDYKGFGINVQLYGVTNVTRDVTLTSFASRLNTVYDTGAWYSPTDASGDVVIPRWASSVSYNNGTQFLYDGSYFRLKNVEISYTWKDGWVKKAGLSSLKLLASGNNLWLWSRMPDDREGNLGGYWGGLGAYPTVKRFNIGIRLSF